MEQYFVKTNDDAPEKGPFDLNAIRESVKRGLFAKNGLARKQDGADWSPIAQVLSMPAGASVPGAVLTKEDRAYAAQLRQEEAERLAARSNSGKSGGMAIGLAMIGLGVVLTAVGYSAAGEGGGGRYILFYGLIIAGIVRVVRSLA